MKLYRIPMTGQWAGTQAEARKLSSSRSGDVYPGFELVDVPTDKDGLLAFLNSREAGILHDDVLVYAVDDRPAQLEITHTQPTETSPAVAPLADRGLPIEEQIDRASWHRCLALHTRLNWRLQQIHAAATPGGAS